MDYYESMEQSHRLRSAAFLCALCAVAAPSFAAPAAPPTSIRAGTAGGTAGGEHPQQRSPCALDAELFYDILVGELSTSQGDPGTGYALMLEAARRSGDAQLYRRATEIALQSRSGEYALAAARAWKEAQPQSREANRYVLQILVPAALPAILSGLKIGWAFAWRTLIAAELVFGASSGQGGLGWYIFQNRNELYTDKVFAGLVLVILIGLLVEGLGFQTLERLTVRRWGVQR